MANGASGRPKAAELANRCSAKNAHGGRCGNPSMTGTQICQVHLGRSDPKQLESMAERLRQGADEAVARLRQVVRDGDNADAVRAAAILLDRVAPKMSSTQALVINVGDGRAVDPTRDPSEVIRARLLELSTADVRRTEMAYSPSTFAYDDDVVDAELVEERRA